MFTYPKHRIIEQTDQYGNKRYAAQIKTDFFSGWRFLYMWVAYDESYKCPSIVFWTVDKISKDPSIFFDNIEEASNLLKLQLEVEEKERVKKLAHAKELAAVPSFEITRKIRAY